MYSEQVSKRRGEEAYGFAGVLGGLEQKALMRRLGQASEMNETLFFCFGHNFVFDCCSPTAALTPSLWLLEGSIRVMLEVPTCRAQAPLASPQLLRPKQADFFHIQPLSHQSDRHHSLSLAKYWPTTPPVATPLVLCSPTSWPYLDEE